MLRKQAADSFLDDLLVDIKEVSQSELQINLIFPVFHMPQKAGLVVYLVFRKRKRDRCL